MIKKRQVLWAGLLDYEKKVKRMRVATQHTPEFEKWDEAWKVVIALVNSGLEEIEIEGEHNRK